VGRRVIEARVHGRKASSHSWLCPTVHSEVFPCFVPEERKLKLCRLIRFILSSKHLSFPTARCDARAMPLRSTLFTCEREERCLLDSVSS